jgi:hypothetical protein
LPKSHFAWSKPFFIPPIKGGTPGDVRTRPSGFYAQRHKFVRSE